MASIVRQLGNGVLRRSVNVLNGFTVVKRHRPVCTVDTNLAKDQIPDSFSSEMSEVIAKSLDKPLQLISVVVRPELEIVRNMAREPTAFVQIWSVGVFDPERNKKYSLEFMDYLVSTLNMPPENIAIMFHPIERYEAGHLLYADQRSGTEKK